MVGGYRLGDVRLVFASPARAAEHLGFTAEIGFADGMAAFAAAEALSGDKVALQYTTTSPRLHALLGVATPQAAS